MTFDFKEVRQEVLWCGGDALEGGVVGLWYSNIARDCLARAEKVREGTRGGDSFTLHCFSRINVRVNADEMPVGEFLSLEIERDS